MSYPVFGEIYYAALQGEDNIQGGTRPVMIASNNIGNKNSNIVEIIPMTSQIQKAKRMPTHVIIPANVRNGLQKDSVVLAEQVATINQSRLVRKIGKLEHKEIVQIGRARLIQSPFPTT